MALNSRPMEGRATLIPLPTMEPMKDVIITAYKTYFCKLSSPELTISIILL